MKLGLSKLHPSLSKINESDLLDTLLNQVDLEKVYEESGIKFKTENVDDILIRLHSNKMPNENQRKAITMALKEKICLIEGTPGTGKTETCVSIVKTMLALNNRVRILAFAHSNVAIDLLAEKLHFAGVELIRYFPKRYEVLNSPLKNLGILKWIFKFHPSLQEEYEDFNKNRMNETQKLNYL